MHIRGRSFYRNEAPEGCFNVYTEFYDMILDMTPNNINNGNPQLNRLDVPADPLMNYDHRRKLKKQQTAKQEEQLPETVEKKPRNRKHEKLFRGNPSTLDGRLLQLMDLIGAIVCTEYQVTKQHLLDRSRKDQYTIPRSICWKLMRDRGASYRYIQYWFGGYDHSSIAHGVKEIYPRVAKNPDTMKRIQNIEKALQNEN